MNGNFFKYGDLKKISEITNLDQVYISKVFSRRVFISKKRALFLAVQCKKIGFNIPFMDFLFSKTTDHPAFKEFKADKLRR